MLSLMRKHAGSWLIKVLLGGVAITFISWGGYQMSSQRSGRAATVNGETRTTRFLDPGRLHLTLEDEDASEKGALKVAVAATDPKQPASNEIQVQVVEPPASGQPEQPDA